MLEVMMSEPDNKHSKPKFTPRSPQTDDSAQHAYHPMSPILLDRSADSLPLLTPLKILQLQRLIGNQAVMRLINQTLAKGSTVATDNSLQRQVKTNTDKQDDKKLQDRAKSSVERADRYKPEKHLKPIAFSSDFDKFVARIAHGIRHRVVYRKDGGKFARSLVRASIDTQRTWNSLKELADKGLLLENQQVRMVVSLWRRADPKAGNRWVMSVRFNESLEKSTKDFMDDDLSDEQITGGDPEKVVDRATVIAKKIKGKHGKRIRDYLELAKKDGNGKSLWYYDPHSVRAFFERLSKKEQEKMLEESGGFPMKGELPGSWQSVPKIRVYPFQELVVYDDSSDEDIRDQLLFMNEEIGKWEPPKSMWNPRGSKALSSKILEEYREHMVELINDESTLYHFWNEHAEGLKWYDSF